MAITTLELGPVGNPIYTFQDEDTSLFSAQYTMGLDVIGVRLTVDTSTCIVNYPFGPDSAQPMAGLDFSCITSSDGYVMCSNKVFPNLKNIPNGTEARLYRRGKLFMKLYKKNANKITPTKFSLSLISAIGIFEDQKHAGGFYNGVAFASVVEEIIDGAVPYTMEDDVAALLVRGGYLPRQSKRENLHWLCFAYGVMIGRNEAGDMHFCFLKNTEATPVPEGDFYEGGDVGDPEDATAVDVVEHSFMELPSDETVVVYDNTDGSETAQNTFLDFRSNAPLHDLSVTGSLSIISSGANWAVVSGTGILSGKKYTHSTRVLSRYADEDDPKRDRIAELSKNTMVTVLNSENVAARMLAYYAYKRVVKTSMVVTDQKMGGLLAGIDPFGEELSGFLSSVNGIISNKIKGTCELISGYVPSGQGTNYSKYFLYTGSGSVDLSTLVADKDNDLVQITLISGGHGGYKGKDGTRGEHHLGGDTINVPGVGGEGGEAGEGGKVLTVTLHVNELAEKVLNYNCGVGGESDTAGGATTLGPYTSDDGAVAAYGVANIFTGEIYAAKGAAKGVKGGDGAGPGVEGTSVYFGGVTYSIGAMGSDINRYGCYSEGGFGGGPAAGRNGGPGGVGDVRRQPNDSVWAGGGVGGDGASPIPGEDATGYGVGGSGGHGGGGAGAGGRAQGSGPSYSNNGRNGAVGIGSLGGKGGPGLMIIYV